MFDELSARFEDAVKGLRGENKISESNVDNALKQVRRALLDADVSLSVVKQFVEEVRQKAIGAEVDRNSKGMGIRSNRYAMIIENLKLINIQVEKETKQCGLSSAETILEML